MGYREQRIWVTRTAWRREDLHPSLSGPRIGRHGSPWTPQTARVEAKRLSGLVAAVGDLAETRATERSAITTAELCDLYLVEGSTPSASLFCILREARNWCGVLLLFSMQRTRAIIFWFLSGRTISASTPVKWLHLIYQPVGVHSSSIRLPRASTRN